MSITSKLPRAAMLAGVAAAAMALGAPAFAGQCPVGKATGDGQRDARHAAKGVDDKVIASIDLAKEAPRLADRKFRLRRLVIQPGGIVPWHSHGERPAIIYIVSGTILEYSSTCAVPIVHRAGEVAPETHATSHWWRNHTRRPVVLLSADILHDKSDPKMM